MCWTACSPNRSPPPSWNAPAPGCASPAQFEAMAFALTRQSADVPVLHFGNLKGGYFGLERTAAGARVGVRKPDGQGRSFFQAGHPGDRSRR